MTSTSRVDLTLSSTPLMEAGDLLEKGLQVAAYLHREQRRKITGIPYLVHPLAVAIILAQAGCTEEILVAAMLHDVLEDTECTSEELARTFPANIIVWVEALSEIKTNPDGEKRKWRERKEEHQSRIKSAAWQVQAIYLADKIHNLRSILHDLNDGHDIWKHFSAGKDETEWYYHTALSIVNRQHPIIVELSKVLEHLIPRVFQ